MVAPFHAGDSTLRLTSIYWHTPTLPSLACLRAKYVAGDNFLLTWFTTDWLQVASASVNSSWQYLEWYCVYWIMRDNHCQGKTNDRGISVRSDLSQNRRRVKIRQLSSMSVGQKNCAAEYLQIGQQGIIHNKPVSLMRPGDSPIRWVRHPNFWGGATRSPKFLDLLFSINFQLLCRVVQELSLQL